MAKQDEFSVISQLDRVTITLRSQYRIVFEKLNQPSAAAKIKQMIDLCEQAKHEMSKYVKPHGEIIAHGTVALPVSTINSQPLANAMRTAYNLYEIAYKINDMQHPSWGEFLEVYNVLSVEQQARVYSKLQELCEDLIPWGFQPIGENNG